MERVCYGTGRRCTGIKMSNSKINVDFMDFSWCMRQRPEKRARIWTVKIPGEFKDHDIICMAVPTGTKLIEFQTKNGLRTCKKCLNTNRADAQFCVACGTKQ